MKSQINIIIEQESDVLQLESLFTSLIKHSRMKAKDIKIEIFWPELEHQNKMRLKQYMEGIKMRVAAMWDISLHQLPKGFKI